MIRTSNIHTKTWYLFSETLPMLYKERDAITNRKSTHFERASINSSILLHLSATLEGAVSSLLYTTLALGSTYDNAKINHDLRMVRLIRSQLDLLQKATWKTLSDDISKTILGYSLSSVYSEDWSAIKYLFDFRNILAHGGLIVFNIDNISDPEDLGSEAIEETEEFMTKKELFKFLHSKDLIEDIGDPSILIWRFINSKVIDYFHFHTKQFLTNLYLEYEKKCQAHSFLENDKIAIQRL